jgi:hypothetical protein
VRDCSFRRFVVGVVADQAYHRRRYWRMTLKLWISERATANNFTPVMMTPSISGTAAVQVTGDSTPLANDGLESLWILEVQGSKKWISDIRLCVAVVISVMLRYERTAWEGLSINRWESVWWLCQGLSTISVAMLAPAEVGRKLQQSFEGWAVEIRKASAKCERNLEIAI